MYTPWHTIIGESINRNEYLYKLDENGKNCSQCCFEYKKIYTWNWLASKVNWMASDNHFMILSESPRIQNNPEISVNFRNFPHSVIYAWLCMEYDKRLNSQTAPIPNSSFIHCHDTFIKSFFNLWNMRLRWICQLFRIRGVRHYIPRRRGWQLLIYKLDFWSIISDISSRKLFLAGIIFRMSARRQWTRPRSQRFIGNFDWKI